MKKNGVRAAILVLCLTLCCCGCGGGGGGESTTTVTTTTTIPTTTTTLAPTVSQKADAANGLLVNSPNGKAPDTELLARLSALCKANSGKLSFYYKDLTNGYSMEYRADYIYQTASVIKAPYVKCLLEKGVDTSQKLKMTKKMGGSSHIDAKPTGTEFTVKELMEYAIRYSDNTAYYMLNEKFGFSDFNAYGKALGVDANARNNLTLVFPKPRFGYLSARDAGLYFEDIARYIETGSESAKLLKEWLTSTTAGGMLAEAFKNTYTIAHKYGEQGSQAYHDAAIVYAPHPYVLTVLTTLEPYAAKSDSVFADLAVLVDSIHAHLYGGVTAPFQESVG